MTAFRPGCQAGEGSAGHSRRDQPVSRVDVWCRCCASADATPPLSSSARKFYAQRNRAFSAWSIFQPSLTSIACSRTSLPHRQHPLPLAAPRSRLQHCARPDYGPGGPECAQGQGSRCPVPAALRRRADPSPTARRPPRLQRRPCRAPTCRPGSPSSRLSSRWPTARTATSVRPHCALRLRSYIKLNLS